MSGDDSDLIARIAELEERVAALELGRAEAPQGQQPRPSEPLSPNATVPTHDAAGDPQGDASEPGPEPSPAPARSSGRPSLVHLVDKIGIALLLLGVAFLLKYSYDQGWLTETFRVALGALTGVVLLASGFHQRHENKALSAVLNGGAIATFYGTIYAAFELYGLLSPAVALSSTIGVTMLSFALAVRQDQPALASIATIGGFATPFLMEGGPEATALSIFASIVLAGASAIFLMKGWKSLLGTAAVGGFCVITVAVFDVNTTAEMVATLVALGLAVAFTAILPVVRAQYFGGEFRALETFSAMSGPLAAMPLVHIAVDESAIVTAFTTAIVGAGFYALSLVVRWNKTYVLLALLLGVSFVGIALDVEPAALTVAAGAVAFSWLGARVSPHLFAPAIICSLPVAGLSLAFLDEASGDLFATSEAIFLVFAVASFVAIGAGLRHAFARWFVWYGASLLGMAVLVSQFDGTADGLVTGMWGAFALSTLIAGFARENGPLQGLGITTVLLTSAKLLFVDLESVDTLVRVALFMVMGGVMLFVSYLVPRWQSDDAHP